MNTSIANRLGLHLSSKQGLLHTLHEAITYQVKYLQIFLPTTKKGRYLKITDEQKDFVAIKQNFFTDIYLHCSYWINPSTGSNVSYLVSKNLLKEEIALAKNLEIFTLVLHAGVAKEHQTSIDDPCAKKKGIQALAKMLNSALKNETAVTILLENSAQAQRAIGSDLQDFTQLQEELACPERVSFCLDLAHAYAYGYNLEDTDTFIKKIDTDLGINNIKLIHFNDSAEPCASRKDRHALPGSGMIGKKILSSLVGHSKLQHLPLIIEPPASSKQSIQTCLNELNSW